VVGAHIEELHEGGGFEYDIFISYRQKDDKGERWVSEFVDALKNALGSTFEEEISVYFDINPIMLHAESASLPALRILSSISIVTGRSGS
jgi:hypothetical protein